MDQERNIQVDEKRYNKLAETSIGFLSFMNPAVILRSHIRQLLDEYLVDIELRDSEIKKLEEFNLGECEDDEIYIPPFHITKTHLNFGNGKDRVTTSVFQIRCHPDHATFMKCILCRMHTESKYPLHFYPEGAILIDGPEKYRSILKEQNEYLFGMTTFPIYAISYEQMRILSPKLLEHRSIRRVIKTQKTEETGRWLVETTKKLEKQAKAHFDNSLMQLEEELEKIQTLTSTPNRNLTTWGATDISDLVSNIKVNHPDPKQENKKENSWVRPPRIRRIIAPHSYEVVANNEANKKTSKQNKAPPSNNSKPDENINGQDLLKEIKSMKDDIIVHCSKMFDTEANNLRKAQEEQQKKIKENEEQQKKDHKLVMTLIQQLTSTLDIIRESLAKHNSIATKNENETEDLSTPQKENIIVTQMEIDPESNKRKDNPSKIKQSLRKNTRSTSNE